MAKFYCKKADQSIELLDSITNEKELWSFCYEMFMDGELSNTNVIEIDDNYFQEIEVEKLQSLQPIERWYNGKGLYNTSFNPPSVV